MSELNTRVALITAGSGMAPQSRKSSLAESPNRKSN